MVEVVEEQHPLMSGTFAGDQKRQHSGYHGNKHRVLHDLIVRDVVHEGKEPVG